VISCRNLQSHVLPAGLNGEFVSNVSSVSKKYMCLPRGAFSRADDGEKILEHILSVGAYC
jgi:hypothetical protein